MAKFTDSKDREWRFPEFTEGTLIDIREATGYDLHLVIDFNEAETARAFSHKGLAEILWFFLGPMAEAAGVDGADLAHSMPYKVKEDAKNALMETFYSFAHGPEVGAQLLKSLRPVMAKNQSLMIAGLRKVSGGSQGSAE